MTDSLPEHLPVVFCPVSGSGSERDLLNGVINRLQQRRISAVYEGNSPARFDVKRPSRHFRDLLHLHDLVIVGSCPQHVPARIVLGEGIPADAENRHEQLFFCRSKAAVEACADSICAWLAACLRRTPVWGCVLIGGASSRMGSPKHLLRTEQGITWLERTVGVLSPGVEQVVVSGRGEMPSPLRGLPRVADLPGVPGPLGGIGAVLEAWPFRSWLVVACDMPALSPECLSWLLEQRQPGLAAVIPRNPLTRKNEPLCAWYDFRSAPLIRALLERGERRLSGICRDERVGQPVIPAEIVDCWRNVNRPEER